MRKLSVLSVIALLAAISTAAYGQRAFDNNMVNYSDEVGQVYLDMPLLTLPEQADAFKTTGGFLSSYMNPGMQNSLAYTADVYTAAHYGIRKLVHFKNSMFLQIFMQKLAIGAFDVMWMQMPLGVSWLHEEYHRGVMSHYGVNSFNEVLLCKLFSGSIAVSHETDENLAMLCDRQHPDFVRLMSAGYEGTVDLNRTLQANEFFYHQNLDNEILYWMHSMQNLIYLMNCANGTGDDRMQERNRTETSVEMRDFTGMDMNAWVHALCYPDTPYSARGVHPSGVGINRYIMHDMIPAEGQAYLNKQFILGFFNLISPMMFGFQRFRLGKGENYGNFAFRHYLTSFGSDVALDLYYQAPEKNLNLYSTVHTYHNLGNHFGGLELGIIDCPLLDNRMQVGGVLMGWIQPKDMLFRAAEGTFGGLAKVRVNYHSRLVDPYLELGWKSKGWVAGNVNLDQGLFCRAGLRWQISK